MIAAITALCRMLSSTVGEFRQYFFPKSRRLMHRHTIFFLPPAVHVHSSYALSLIHILSLFFIWEVYGSTKIQLLYLIGYVIFAAYLVKIYLYLRKKYGRNKYIYGHAVFLSLLPLLVYKIGGLRGYSVFGFLGISYICFKIIQVVIECYDGVIKEIDEFQFIEFLIFFPCLSSGPIDRSRRFAEDDNKIWSRQEYIELLWTGLYKIILGIFYRCV